jgi:15-cis-phytoene synthase
LKGRGYRDLNLDLSRKHVCNALMNLQHDALSPPSRLALAYAKGPACPFLELVLTLDNKLAAIVGNGKEPLIGQMRMAWWSDVITKPAEQRPQGEPLLARLTALDATPIGDAVQAAMLQLVEAWDMLLANAAWTPDVLHAHAQAKAKAIFGGYAGIMGVGEPDAKACRDAGEYWAYSGLLQHCQTAAQYDAVSAALVAQAAPHRLRRDMRPLAILAFAARQEQDPQAGNLRQGLRLIFNALTGW